MDYATRLAISEASQDLLDLQDEKDNLMRDLAETDGTVERALIRQNIRRVDYLIDETISRIANISL